jgi:hypothetical protein
VQKIFSPEWNHLSAVKATTVVAETRERHTKNDQPAAMTTRSIKQQRVRASGPPALQHRPSRRSADRSCCANGSRFHLRRPPWPEGWCQHPHDRAKVDQDDRDGSPDKSCRRRRPSCDVRGRDDLRVSEASGRCAISSDSTLALRWTEIDGPPVQKPTRHPGL